MSILSSPLFQSILLGALIFPMYRLFTWVIKTFMSKQDKGMVIAGVLAFLMHPVCIVTPPMTAYVLGFEPRYVLFTFISELGLVLLLVFINRVFLPMIWVKKSKKPEAS